MTKKSGSPTKVDIVVYALHALGGDRRYVHLEDIAIRCYELAPDRFSWERYPQYPDADAARSALTDAAKEQHGKLVMTSKATASKARTKGQVMWALSRAGAQWIEANLNRLSAATHASPAAHPRQEVQQQIAPILRHPAYQVYARDPENAPIEEAGFVDSLRCTLNTPPEVLSKKLELAMTRAQAAHHEGLLQYLQLCKTRFGHLLSSD